MTRWSSAGTRVERHDRTTTGPERADAQFNSAMNLLNAGRVAEVSMSVAGSSLRSQHHARVFRRPFTRNHPAANRVGT